MSKLKRLLLSFPIVVTILLLLYFYFAPIYVKGLSIFHTRRLSLNDARNYYSVLSSFITLLGLFLGYFYYRHKLKTDEKVSNTERKRKRLDDLISKIDDYDRLVDDLIHHNFRDEKELKQLRNKISRSFETIEVMLTLNINLLGLSEDDIKTIIKVNSFVDKNDLLMNANYTTFISDSMYSVRDQYINLINDARRSCFKNVS